MFYFTNKYWRSIDLKNTAVFWILFFRFHCSLDFISHLILFACCTLVDDLVGHMSLGSTNTCSRIVDVNVTAREYRIKNNPNNQNNRSFGVTVMVALLDILHRVKEYNAAMYRTK